MTRHHTPIDSVTRREMEMPKNNFEAREMLSSTIQRLLATKPMDNDALALVNDAYSEVTDLCKAEIGIE